jgi:ABC-type bacteriocin/lantibiotic exporter with double-glycine peptidase domain
MGRIELRALWRLLRDRRWRLLVGVVVLGLQAMVLLPITLLVHNIFAAQIPAADSRAVLVSGIEILLLYVASAVLSLGARRLILVASFDSIAALRRQVLARLHELPLSWHERQDIGRLHASLVLDGERLEASLPSLVVLLQAFVVGVPLTVVAVIVSPLLAGVVALVIPAMLVLNSKQKGRTERAIKRWSDTHRVWAAQVLRTLRSMQLIRTRGVDAVELEHGGQRVASLAADGLSKSWVSNVATVINTAIAGVAGCVILTVGGVAVAKGALSIGSLLAFYAVIALLLRSVTGAAGSGANLMVATGALLPLQAIVDDPHPPVYSGTRREPFDGAVALRGVTVGYDVRPVLCDLDLDIAAGERVAVVGPNGAGKSTLARVVLGLDRPWRGTVTASGHPLDDIDVAAMRRQIGVVLQDASIRPGTIVENVTFGRPDLTDAQVARALAAAGVTEMLDHRFPDGVHTDVGDDGARLSGGQRQAISLARALVGDPRLLILDEPTNHLDTAATHRLLRTIEAMRPPPAVLLITHDFELAAWADRVVQLENGQAHANRPMASQG